MARQQQGGREGGREQQQQQGGGPQGSTDRQQGVAAGQRAGSGSAGAGSTAGGSTAGASAATGEVRGPGGAASTSGGGGQSVSGAQGGGTETHGERERSVPRSREGGADAGSTMQRSAGGGARSGTLGSRQPSPVSSFLAGDPFAVADQMITSPFSFMRRFSEEMDRLFADFGFAPGGYGYGSTGYGPAGYGLTGAASPTAGNREVGGQQRQGRSQALQQQGGRGSSALGSTRSRAWTPQIELFQRGDQIVVRADLPGLNKDDVDVEVHEGVLTISGERREQHEDRGEGFYHSERSYGSFQRSIPLPEGVNEEQINAQFRDGVLEVTIPVPRQEQQRGRRIDIRT